MLLKIPHLTSTVCSLLSDRLLCWKEPILLSYPLLLTRDAQGCTLHFRRPIREAKDPGLKLLGGHKFNVESEHIYCSLISIHYQLNPPRETNAEPLFASKIFSLDVPNDSPYTFTTHDRWKPARQPCLLCKPRLARNHTVTWHRGSRTSRSCNYCCSPDPRGKGNHDLAPLN